MSILLTDADGYIDWPVALWLAARTGERVVRVDNFAQLTETAFEPEWVLREWIRDIETWIERSRLELIDI
jgi:nucleoside-diphosphate-sugar epimerase